MGFNTGIAPTPSTNMNIQKANYFIDLFKPEHDVINRINYGINITISSNAMDFPTHPTSLDPEVIYTVYIKGVGTESSEDKNYKMTCNREQLNKYIFNFIMLGFKIRFIKDRYNKKHNQKLVNKLFDLYETLNSVYHEYDIKLPTDINLIPIITKDLLAINRIIRDYIYYFTIPRRSLVNCNAIYRKYVDQGLLDDYTNN